MYLFLAVAGGSSEKRADGDRIKVALIRARVKQNPEDAVHRRTASHRLWDRSASRGGDGPSAEVGSPHPMAELSRQRRRLLALRAEKRYIAWPFAPDVRGIAIENPSRKPSRERDWRNP